MSYAPVSLNTAHLLATLPGGLTRGSAAVRLTRCSHRLVAGLQATLLGHDVGPP